jgi:hypothetical protein
MITTLRSPDGAKRKRRSVQPVYASRRRRRLWLTIGISVACVAILCYYGFSFAQRIRLEGETFRDGVNRRISEALGCQVEINRIFDGGDKSLAATEARFDTQEAKDIVQSGTFNNLSASLTPSSWVSDQWGILMLSMTDGSITLNPERPATPPDSARIVPHIAGKGRSTEGGWRFGINPEPDRITIDKLQFTKGFNLEWPAKPPQPPEGIRKLRGHVKFPRSGEMSGGMEGSFSDGTMVLTEMPEVRIETVRWTLKERHLEILGSRVSFGGRASASISGHAELVSDGTVELKADILSTPLTSILPRIWHEAVLGMFSAEKTAFRASFGKGPERVYEGDFTVKGVIFAGFLFMSKFADALGHPEISRPEFPVLTGHFKWSPSTGVEITEISGEKEGLLRLNGSVRVNLQGSVDGRLKVSASETALRGAPPNAPKLFGPISGEWASLEFGIKGDPKSLVDDIIMPESSGVGAVPTPAPTSDTPAPAPTSPDPKATAPRPPAPAAPRKPKPSNAELEKELDELMRANKATPR